MKLHRGVTVALQAVLLLVPIAVVTAIAGCRACNAPALVRMLLAHPGCAVFAAARPVFEVLDWLTAQPMPTAEMLARACRAGEAAQSVGTLAAWAMCPCTTRVLGLCHAPCSLWTI